MYLKHYCLLIITIYFNPEKNLSRIKKIEAFTAMIFYCLDSQGNELWSKSRPLFKFWHCNFLAELLNVNNYVFSASVKVL